MSLLTLDGSNGELTSEGTTVLPSALAGWRCRRSHSELTMDNSSIGNNAFLSIIGPKGGSLRRLRGLFSCFGNFAL